MKAQCMHGCMFGFSYIRSLQQQFRNKMKGGIYTPAEGA